ncbi:MAG TPA: hypothetical protein VHE78_12110 [Gemmatimonadaceae bacterium]|nr:hypothetical protein [Gemmatimonadaceae bacterium]
MRSLRLLPFAILIVGAGCGSPTAPLPIGPWGGVHLLLTLTPAGGAAEYDCAHGSISSAIQVDGAGRFDVAGTFVPERGGPSRSGDTLPEYPARYAGRIIGDLMTVTVTRTDSAITIGSYSLQRGADARVLKCL